MITYLLHAAVKRTILPFFERFKMCDDMLQTAFKWKTFTNWPITSFSLLKVQRLKGRVHLKELTFYDVLNQQLPNVTYSYSIPPVQKDPWTELLLIYIMTLLDIYIFLQLNRNKILFCLNFLRCVSLGLAWGSDKQSPFSLALLTLY